MNLKNRLEKLESKVCAVIKPIKIIWHNQELPEDEAREAMAIEAAEAEAAGFKVINIVPAKWGWEQDPVTLRWHERTQ